MITKPAQKAPISSLNDNTPLIQWSTEPQPVETQPNEIPGEYQLFLGTW